jgi:hypothetical protein
LYDNAGPRRLQSRLRHQKTIVKEHQTLQPVPLRSAAFVLLLTLLFDQQSKNVNNYFVGVVLLQHATLPHLNTLNKNQPNPMAILMLLFVNVLQRTVV